MRKVIILQARLASSRFPKKVLAELSGKSVIAQIIDRLKAAKKADAICAAIPTGSEEDPLAEALAPLGVEIVRGSGPDVLGRFIQAAYATGADVIVRTTGDNPFVSFSEIDRQLTELEADPGLDYVITEGYPLGITTESFTLKTLEKMDYLGRHHNEREHVTLYLRKNPGPFAIKTLLAPKELTKPDLKLSLDTLQDYELIKMVFAHLYKPGKHIGLSDILALLEQDPELAKISRMELAAWARA